MGYDKVNTVVDSIDRLFPKDKDFLYLGYWKRRLVNLAETEIQNMNRMNQYNILRCLNKFDDTKHIKKRLLEDFMQDESFVEDMQILSHYELLQEGVLCTMLDELDKKFPNYREVLEEGVKRGIYTYSDLQKAKEKSINENYKVILDNLRRYEKFGDISKSEMKILRLFIQRSLDPLIDVIEMVKNKETVSGNESRGIISARRVLLDYSYSHNRIPRSLM